MLSDAQWEMVEELLPRRTGRKGRPFSDPRQMLEGILYRLRAGIAWRDLPACFGSWQTVYTWHNRMAKDGTWDVILQRLLTQADTEDLIDWSVSVDFDDHPGPSARHEHHAGHRGLCRITTTRWPSRLITRSADHGVVCLPRSTPWSTATACP